MVISSLSEALIYARDMERRQYICMGEYLTIVSTGKEIRVGES